MAKILVAYYSRTGNTKNLAEVVSETLATKGNYVKLHEAKLVKEPSYLGCCFRARLGLTMPIHNLKFDCKEFDVVAIGSPVWAFTIAPPIISVAKQLGEKGCLKVNKVVPFLTCGGMPGSAPTAFLKALSSLGATAEEPFTAVFEGSSPKHGMKGIRGQLAEIIEKSLA